MGLLVDAGVSQGDAHGAIDALKAVFAPRALMPGQEITLSLGHLDSDAAKPNMDLQLVGLSLQPSVERDVQVRRGIDGGFVAAAIDKPLTVNVARAAADIDSSLFESASAEAVPMSVMTQVIRAFSYDVDFQREIQPGDHYEIVYERIEDDQGNLARTGKVLYAALTLSGKQLELYQFTTPDGRADFYTPQGDSVRKALLRTPIDGARISSGFGMRKHPVLGFTKMHKGVDFAAPTGTPIFAAGDGTVVRIGRNGSYGNYIQIKHNQQYATAYAHLSRFAKGLRPGSRVDQGDVIAYVGMTGRATGPHLHYEVLVSGGQINPLSVKLQAGHKLEGKDLKRFLAQVQEVDQKRQRLESPALVATQ